MEKRISSVAFLGIRNPCRSEGLPRGTRNEFSSRAVFGNVFQLFAEGEVNIGNIPRDEVKGIFTNIHEPEANNCFSNLVIQNGGRRIREKTRREIIWVNVSFHRLCSQMTSTFF